MKSRFGQLLKSAVQKIRDRGFSMEGVAKRLNITPQSLYAAIREQRCVIGIETVERVIEEAKLNADERYELETAWLFTRLKFSSLGRIFLTMDEEMRRGKSQAEIRKVHERLSPNTAS